VGNRGHEPLAVQAVQVGKCSLGYGLRQGHLALVGRSPISFRSLRVLPVVDGQAHIPVLLTRRKTFTFLRSGGDRQPASAHCPGDGQRGPPVLEPLPNQHVRFRRILIRWDKHPDNYIAFLHFACALIAFRAAGLLG
jgi:hypothetical protein